MRQPNLATALLVLMANGKLRQCPDPTRLNDVLIRHIHTGLMLNAILLWLAGMKYLIIVDVSSGFCNLKLGDKSTYLTTFPCPFGRYQYVRLPFAAAPVENMFWKNIDELFSGMPTVLFQWWHFNCRLWWTWMGHYEIMEEVLWICRQT